MFSFSHCLHSLTTMVVMCTSTVGTFIAPSISEHLAKMSLQMVLREVREHISFSALAGISSFAISTCDHTVHFAAFSQPVSRIVSMELQTTIIDARHSIHRHKSDMYEYKYLDFITAWS